MIEYRAIYADKTAGPVRNDREAAMWDLFGQQGRVAASVRINTPFEDDWCDALAEDAARAKEIREELKREWGL